MATHSSVLAWRIPGTGALWAAIYGVAQSWTQLKRLSSSSSNLIPLVYNSPLIITLPAISHYSLLLNLVN